MSNSLNNTIYLNDPPDVIREKIAPMVTDTRRKRKTDPGIPEDCPVFTLHKAFVEEEKREEMAQGCRTARIGCLECKNVVIDSLIETLTPFQEKRREFKKNPQLVWDIIDEGNRKARQTAQKTMEEVREAIGL
jgi:tryptophanyl-tRNA synthetase